MQLHDGLALVKTSAREMLYRDQRWGNPTCLSRVFQDFTYINTAPRDVGYTLRLNNLSKLPLPCFAEGDAATTSHIITMAGPTTVLSAPNGDVRVYLAPDALTGGVSADELKTALLTF